MKIKWKVIKAQDGWEGVVELPDQLGHRVKVTATANTKEKALARSAAIASKALDNPAVQALLPPGTGPALKAVARVASGPAAAKLVRGIRGLF